MIFDGKDLKAYAVPQDDRALLVVTFTGREHAPPAGQGAGEFFLAKNGIDAVHFVSKANHWWQSDEFGAALAATRAYADANGYAEVVTYGSSMGGFGALTASGRLKANRVVVSVPQFSIDPAVVAWEKRWIKDARRIAFRKEPVAGLIGEADIIVLLDTLYGPDARHAALIAAVRPIRTIAVPFADHDVSRVLADVGLLSEVTLEALRGRYDKPAFQARLRRARAGSPLMWGGAARLLSERRKPRLALRFSARAVEMLIEAPPEVIRPEHDRVIAFNNRILLAAGRPAEALAVLNRWARVKPFGWSEFQQLALAYSALDDDRAVDAIVLAARGRSKDRHVLGDVVRIAGRLAPREQVVALLEEFRPELLALPSVGVRAARMLQSRGLEADACALAAAIADAHPAEAPQLAGLLAPPAALRTAS